MKGIKGKNPVGFSKENDIFFYKPSNVTVGNNPKGYENTVTIPQILALEAADSIFISSYSNTKLVEKATSKDIFLRYHSKKYGKKVQSKIAENLVAMYWEMDKRIRLKGKKIDFTPPKGLQWSSEIFMGMVEGIYPFHMKEYFWDPYIINNRSKTKRKKNSIVKNKSVKNKRVKNKSGEKPPSLAGSVSKARKAMKERHKYKIPDMGPDKRIYCLLNRIENKSGDASITTSGQIMAAQKEYWDFIKSRIGKIKNHKLPKTEEYILSKKYPEWEKEIFSPKKSKFWQHAYIIKLASYIASLKLLNKRWVNRWFWDAREYLINRITNSKVRGYSNKAILWGLRQLNEFIMSSIRFFLKEKSKYTLGGHLGKVAFLLQGKIRSLQKDKDSVMSCYKGDFSH